MGSLRCFNLETYFNFCFSYLREASLSIIIEIYENEYILICYLKNHLEE